MTRLLRFCFIFFFIIAASLLARAAESKKPEWGKVDPTRAKVIEEELEKEIERGRKTYNFYCYYCHGYSGDSKTLASSFLTPKPRDFTAITSDRLGREEMISAVRNGKPGTAMSAFETVLKPKDIEAVVTFVRDEFMRNKAKNTWYHTPENGWENHERYAAAFPFAKGEIPLDTPDNKLNPEQLAGKKLFMESCISCHDRAHVLKEGAVWSKTTGLTGQERMGETLFQENCAFCHDRNGAGKNWIGAFLKPHPRDLRNDPVMDSMTKSRMRKTIRNGLPGSSMPAWRDVLTNEQIDAIISYVSKVFHPIKNG